MPSELSQDQKQTLGTVSQLYQPPLITVKQPGRLRFGLIADPQYADTDTEHQRYYRNSLKKLSQAIDILNQQSLDFVVTLGDIVDRYWRDYSRILPLYRKLQHPHLAIIGNHDAQVIQSHLMAQPDILPLPKHYYSLQLAGFRLIIIDGNDISFYCTPANGSDPQQAETLFNHLLRCNAPQAQVWNGALGQQQLRWLKQQLIQAENNEEIPLIFSHYPVAGKNIHNLWNSEQVTNLLCRHQVRAIFSGHDHRGGYLRINNTDFIIIKGMVEQADPTPFAIAEFNRNHLSLHGYATQQSLTSH